MITGRLHLRRPDCDDAGWYAQLNADPEVARFLGYPPMTREQSDASLGRMRAHWEEYGFGLWIAERLDTGEPIGYVGLAVPSFLPQLLPAVEVGWRLAPRHWGRGFATEGAEAALDQGFTVLGLERIVSITVHDNRRSRAVMERLGLRRMAAEVHPGNGSILEVRNLDRDKWMAASVR